MTTLLRVCFALIARLASERRCVARTAGARIATARRAPRALPMAPASTPRSCRILLLVVVVVVVLFHRLLRKIERYDVCRRPHDGVQSAESRCEFRIRFAIRRVCSSGSIQQRSNVVGAQVERGADHVRHDNERANQVSRSRSLSFFSVLSPITLLPL